MPLVSISSNKGSYVQWVNQAQRWGFHKYNTRNHSPSRITQTVAQDELRQQLSLSQSDGAYTHNQPTDPVHDTVPHTFSIQGDYSRTCDLHQAPQPSQYAMNASQAINKASWLHIGNSGRPGEQYSHAPGQTYTDTFAHTQSAPDLSQNESMMPYMPSGILNTRNQKDSGTLPNPHITYPLNDEQFDLGSIPAEAQSALVTSYVPYTHNGDDLHWANTLTREQSAAVASQIPHTLNGEASDPASIHTNIGTWPGSGPINQTPQSPPYYYNYEEFPPQ
jgi:hypothetical protein